MVREPAPSVNRHVPVYPMRTLVRLAGVERHVIYAWEKRGLIKPARTEGGHRLFSEEDVEQIRRMMLLQEHADRVRVLHERRASVSGSPAVPRGERS